MTSTGTSSAPASERHRGQVAVVHAEARRRRRDGRAACSGPCPSRAPATLCIHELFERRWRRLISTRSSAGRSSRAASRGRSAVMYVGREHDLAVGRLQHLGEPRHHRAEVDAVRRGLHLVEVEPVGILAVAVTARAGAQRQVEQALGTAVVVVLAQRRRRRGRARRRARRRTRRRSRRRRPRSSAARGTGRPSRIRISHSCGPAVGRAGRSAPSTWRRCRPRSCQIRSSWCGCSSARQPGQDDVGVAGGLVDPVVDADHAVEPVQRLVEPVAARASTAPGCRRP